MSEYEMTNTISIENQDSAQLEHSEEHSEQIEKVIQSKLPDKYGNGYSTNRFKRSRNNEKLKQKELLRENAILKKEIATLSWQIDRLKTAMRELVE